MDPVEPIKAFEFAKELVTQLITLSTGTIALTITFAKEFLKNTSAETRKLAMISWGLFFASLIAGLATLMALAGNLNPLVGPPNLSIRSLNIVRPAGLQIVFFLAGMALTIAFAVRALADDASEVQKSKGIANASSAASDSTSAGPEDNGG